MIYTKQEVCIYSREDSTASLVCEDRKESYPAPLECLGGEGEGIGYISPGRGRREGMGKDKISDLHGS